MKSDRIVFRHYSQTVECFMLDGDAGWWCAVQGETEPRGPFKTSGKAVEQGLAVAEKNHAIKKRIQQRTTRRQVAENTRHHRKAKK